MKFSEVTVNQSTGSVTVRTGFPNPEQLLLPGMFVRAIVEEGVNEQAVLVPQKSITPGQSLVIYRDEQVLGGGVIDSAIPA